MALTTGRRAEGPSAGLVSLCLAALLGGGLCLTVAFLSAPALGVVAGLALVWSIAASVAAGLGWRAARRAAAQAEKLSGEVDLLSRRLLALEQRPAPAAGPEPPRQQSGEADLSELTAEIGLLGSIVREIAVTVAAQDQEIARLKQPPPPPPPASKNPIPERPAPEAPRPPASEPGIRPRSEAPPRGRSLPGEQAAPRPFVPEPALPRPVASGAEARRREQAILEALTQGGLEVHLQPIVSLPQRKVAFYEALTRLSLGEARLTPAEFIPTLERHGRTTELDRLMLARVTAIGRQLAARGSTAAVAYALSPSSLFEPGFLRGLGRLIEAHPELAGRMILALPQRSLRSLDGEQSAALAALRGRIPLALDRAGDLRFDGSALAALGIAYAKVPADLLLGRRGGTPEVAPEDLAAALARAGIRLIAEAVERDADVPDLIDLDLPLAQGDVFAAPRIVRPEVLQPPEAPPEPEPPDPAPPAEDPPVRRSFRDFLRRAV
ncbi:diguanylate phosphodiesterase [Methylobacterium sp. 4-46]|uniref:EAL domain-containing protein n=1 Tax=unclassified Methylobacterium TaxID=2615210 RepID=UPI000152E203|nr:MULTISPECIES: EAL domain-containing protein [Methylobacterium]ACA16268.1 diguanylate phosphodiesterase [Methylobacterium sp. 4-46]WFT81977.1 EAL domain-containing protein [Methylobacterium nodulans]